MVPSELDTRKGELYRLSDNCAVGKWNPELCGPEVVWYINCMYIEILSVYNLWSILVSRIDLDICACPATQDILLPLPIFILYVNRHVVHSKICILYK